jgi:hypothetical protein
MTKRDDTPHHTGDRLFIIRTTYLLAALGIASVLLLAGLAAYSAAGSVASVAITAVVTITTASIQLATRSGRRP